MSKLSDKHCEVCLQKGIRKKVRTLCDECRKLLCKECSDAHLLFKVSKNHNLIDLDPPREESRSANEDKLATDFLKSATISEPTVLYRAQFAVESGPNYGEEKESKSKTETLAKTEEKKVDLSKLKPEKVTEFSLKRSDDKRNVTVNGVLCLSDKVLIVDYYNNKLKLYDNSGHYLSSTDLKQFTRGITRVNNDKFATCGSGNKVFLWTVRAVRRLLFWTVGGQSIINEDEVYDVDHRACGIHYNETYYCVLHRHHNAITILDRQGRQVRKIVMKEAFGKEIKFGFDIHMDRDTYDIYVSCLSPDGVLCMSVEGEAVWFAPLSDSVPWGITEIHGALCVVDRKEHQHCLHLISKTRQYIGKLLDKDKLAGQPKYIDYNEQEQKLYISYFFHSSDTGKRDNISVYSV